MDRRTVERILNTPKWERDMLPWEHCAMELYSIPYSLVVRNIEMKRILRCKYNGEVYYFNIGIPEPEITEEMIKEGIWAVYTWSS